MESLVGKRLRETREALGFSALKVDDLTNHHFKEKTILAWERGDINISVKNLEDICSFYGTTASEILSSGYNTIDLGTFEPDAAKAMRTMATHLRRKSEPKETTRAS